MNIFYSKNYHMWYSYATYFRIREVLTFIQFKIIFELIIIYLFFTTTT